MLMTRRRVCLLLLCGLALLSAFALAAGCGGSGPGTTTSSSVASTDSSEASGSGAALEVTGPGGTKSYTLDQIKTMQSTEGYGGMKSSTGHITPPAPMKGVLMEDLFADVGGFPEDMAVSIIAKDGYEMTMSHTQLTSGDFLTYDMVTGAENKVEGPLRAIIAYERDGQPLDPESDGTLRLAIVSAKKDQVTDGHWSVKWVTKLQIKPIEQDWTLALSGRLNEEIDRSTFESCAAAGCHGQNWTAGDGTKWTGVPLYNLVGRVDDENAHEGPAYNRELANAGYDVELVKADGSSIKVSSQIMFYNKDLIVAYQLNDKALPEEFWPLRLVGKGIDSADMVGQITDIKVLLPTK
jgi:DMSO/TMAO reductase YedYZ molybdopterin-dependent catalytic subunit